MGCHPIVDYGVAVYTGEKQALIYQQHLSSKILILWIKNSLTTDAKLELRAYKNSYAYNNQNYGAAMFFVIVKMVRPDTCARCSYIKTKLETMKISQLKYDITRSNLHIEEWMNDISIAGKTYPEFLMQPFNL